MKLIDTLEAYCKNNDIIFILGTQDYQNLEADIYGYKNGQLILLCDVSYSVNIYSGSVTGYSYNVTLGLGRKFDEDGDEAGLDEFYLQKYHLRLRDLSDKLNEILGNIACLGDLEIDSFSVKYDINKFDLCADFVVGSGVIRQNN